MNETKRANREHFIVKFRLWTTLLQPALVIMIINHVARVHNIFPNGYFSKDTVERGAVGVRSPVQGREFFASNCIKKYRKKIVSMVKRKRKNLAFELVSLVQLEKRVLSWRNFSITELLKYEHLVPGDFLLTLNLVNYWLRKNFVRWDGYFYQMWK